MLVIDSNQAQAANVPAIARDSLAMGLAVDAELTASEGKSIHPVCVDFLLVSIYPGFIFARLKSGSN